MKKRSYKIKVHCFNYFICSGDCRRDLEDKVVKMSKSGWVPVGGVAVTENLFHQAMALYD